MDVKCRKNHKLAIGFARSLIKMGEIVALYLEKTHNSCTHLTFKISVGYAMANTVSKGVSKVAGHNSEACK